MQVALSPRRRLGTFRVGETVAHQISTGFWYVWQPDIGLLDDEFLQIWNGEGGTFAACDRIYFAFMQADPTGQNPYWGQTVAPGFDPVTVGFTWPNSTASERINTWREANAWVGRATSEPSGDGNEACALSKVKEMNAYPTNPRAMRAVISRALWGLVHPGSGATPWTIPRLQAYVGRICERLQKGTEVGDDDLRNVCRGWNLADDTFTKAVDGSTASLDDWEEVLDAVHETQTDYGLNLP